MPGQEFDDPVNGVIRYVLEGVFGVESVKGPTGPLGNGTLERFVRRDPELLLLFSSS
jgi:hypothetical protein